MTLNKTSNQRTPSACLSESAFLDYRPLCNFVFLILKSLCTKFTKLLKNRRTKYEVKVAQKFCSSGKSYKDKGEKMPEDSPLVGTLHRFSQESALHSLHIFFSPIRKWRVRLCWMMLLMSSVLFGVYVSFNELTLFFSDRPTVTEVKMVDNTYLDLPQVSKGINIKTILMI